MLRRLIVVAAVSLLVGPVFATQAVGQVNDVDTELVPGAGLRLSRQPTIRLVAPAATPAVVTTPVDLEGSGPPRSSWWFALVGILWRPTAPAARLKRRYRGSTLRQMGHKLSPATNGLRSSSVVSVEEVVDADKILRRYDSRTPLPSKTLIVTVGGFGSVPGETFTRMLASMGVSNDYVASFDWNWISRFASSEEASREASIDQGIIVMTRWLETLPADANIHFIGHSKGAVLIAEFLALQDLTGSFDPRIRTVMLLDPPLAGSVLGAAQSLGYAVGGRLPNDGGYDREWSGGVDKLNGLGRAGDVVVRIIRNPDAIVTNLSPTPGVVMYDLEDDGAGTPLDAAYEASVPWLSRALPIVDVVIRLAAAGRRVADAHSDIVNDPNVAIVTRREIVEPGSSTWTAGPVYAIPGS